MHVLKPDQARRELAARGLTITGWARLSGVHYTTISRALHGRPLQDPTVLRLQAALDRVPILPLPNVNRIAEVVPAGLDQLAPSVSRSRNAAGLSAAAPREDSDDAGPIAGAPHTV